MKETIKLLTHKPFR